MTYRPTGIELVEVQKKQKASVNIRAQILL